MASKLVRVLIGVIIGALLSWALFSAGLVLGARIPSLVQGQLPGNLWIPSAEATSPAVVSPLATEQGGELFRPFWEAWDIVHEQFVDQPLDDQRLMQGAIQGMVDALGDPQSAYMNPDQARQATIPLEGQYEGIGAWVDTDAEFLTIISPMPDSPAEKAGLRPGDEVIAVDGEDMTGLDPTLVLRRVLGPAGSTVELTLRRAGEPEPLVVTIVRARIVVPSMQSKMLEQGIGYIQLYSFSESTVTDLRQALSELLPQNPAGLILDLRGNAGGFLTTSIDVASEFLADGVIMTERFGDGTEQVYRASGDGMATEIPLVVLINAGSASASEIVAGAIQDYGRGLLVGEKSFGKGSVQNWVDLSGGEGTVRVTIARWFTPNGRSIDEVGLEPDVAVPFTEEDLQNERDPQLEKATELLLAQPLETEATSLIGW